MKPKPAMVNAATITIATSLVITSCLLNLHIAHGFSLNNLPPPMCLHANILVTRHPRHRHDRQHWQRLVVTGNRGGGGSGTNRESDLPSRSMLSCDHDYNGTEECNYFNDTIIATATRRTFCTTTLMTTASSALFFMTMPPSAAHAVKVDGIELVNDDATAGISSSHGKSTADATITDKIFIEFKGLSPLSITTDGQNNNSNSNGDRIIIGLFGNDAPQPVSILKQLVTKEGYKDAKCKPLDATRTLIKEQLEANKVYNTCMETEDTMGVNYDYATVWRVVKNERMDVGAVSGRFVARENPNFVDSGDSYNGSSRLRHDAAGVVSVRRGNEGGFGFTIFPGVNRGDNAKAIEAAAMASRTLDGENIVVGRILEGMDVVQRLNDLPVVKQSAGSILGGGGGGGGKEKSKVAPSRGCRYGGTELYCNEYKPLRKVLLDETGVL